MSKKYSKSAEKRAERKKEVEKLFTEGKTSKEVAVELGIALNTLYNFCVKEGIKNPNPRGPKKGTYHKTGGNSSILELSQNIIVADTSSRTASFLEKFKKELENVQSSNN